MAKKKKKYDQKNFKNNKERIAKKLVEQFNIQIADAKKYVGCVIDQIGFLILLDKNIIFKNFGTFFVREKKACNYKGIDGKWRVIKPKNRIIFRPCKRLKRLANNGETKILAEWDDFDSK